jgi:DNA-binding transcriptional LysR family regulator
MDLEQLRAFLAVVETGSFLTAAKALKVSRATLRRRIDELEVRAGIRLLERTPLGAVVTEPGRVLATRGRLLVQEAGALLNSVREIGSAPAGLLRIMLPAGLPPHVLTPLFGMVREQYPKLTFHIRFSDDPTGGLLDDVDLALHFGAESPQGPWITHELLRVRVWPIASTEYLSRRGTPRSLGELASHDLLTWEAPGEDGQSWPLLGGGSFPVKPLLLATDIHLLRQYAAAGYGIALVPDAMLPDPGLPEGALIPVLSDVVGREIPLRMVVPAALAELPKIKALLDLVQPFVGEL